MQNEEILRVLQLFYGFSGGAFGGSHIEADDQRTKDAFGAHPRCRKVNAPLSAYLFDRYSAYSLLLVSPAMHMYYLRCNILLILYPPLI